MSWGHGHLDYSTRASRGNNDKPLFDEMIERNYNNQGLLRDKFEEIVNHLL